MPEKGRNRETAVQPPILHARDWTGEDDPGNPRNFPLRRRVFSTIAVTALAFVSTFAASIYSAGTDDVCKTFNISEEVATLGLSLFNVGLAAGPLIGAPLSETLGRKIVILSTTPFFALFTIGAGFANNIASLLTLRLLAGIAAAPAVGNASATIADYTAGPHRAISFGIYYSVPTFGAVLGPLIGGFVVKAKGWRWIEWTTTFFIVAFYVPVLFTSETYKKKILQRRAKKLGVEGLVVSERTVIETLRYSVTTVLLRPIHMLLTEPIITLVCLYSGFLFGLMYTFVVASPWVYKHYYGFDTVGQSLSFLGLIIGTIIAPVPLTLIDFYIYQPRLRKFKITMMGNQQFPPEHRLYPSIAASFILPACLIVFAWTARLHIHWIIPIIFQGLSILMSSLIYASTNLFMMDSYGPLYGASAASAAMLSRYTFSATFPLFSLQMYKALGAGWAMTLLGFCTLTMAPIPWLFWKCGERLRGKGRYETSA